VRQTRDASLLTLKSGDVETEGVSTRFELEAPWSADAFAAAVERLRWQGIDLPAASADPGPSIGQGEDPVATWAAAGLRLVQDRRTRRQSRDVLPPGASDPEGRIAEIDVDAVRYRLDGTYVRIFEVEVEGKGAGDAGAVASVLRALGERFTGRLRPWRHSKLATGFALRDLQARGQLASHLGRDDVLQESGVKAVDELLGGGAALV
jgi:inorganic triphosphatase YgiF